MSNHEHAPLLSEAFHEFVQVRDPIFAAPPKSAWQLIKQAAKRAWNETEEMSLRESWHYSWQTAAQHGFRRIKAAIYQHEFIKPLKTGEKKSVGHTIPRHEQSAFARIDRGIWHEGHIDIPKSHVKADDVAFAGVRILPVGEVEGTGPAPKSQGPETCTSPSLTDVKGKAGRPSVKSYVWAACDHLWENESFQTASRKQQARMVKEVIQIDDPTDRANYDKLTDGTIQDHIYDYLIQRRKQPRL